jgi:Tol biopolymer transport system component
MASCRSSQVTAPPPNPTRIVFDGAQAGGTRSIYTISVDGTGLTRLTRDNADNWSPTEQGEKVVYVSARGGGHTLYTVPVAGGTGTALSATGTAADEPALSPAGAKLAYANTHALPRVWVAAANGSSAARFAAADSGAGESGNFSSAIEHRPTWSPSGDSIAYMSTRGGSAALYVAPLAGAPGSAAQVVGGNGTGNNVEPAWSPDGTRLAFSSDRSGQTDLYVVVLSSATVTRLTTMGNVGQPAWLADGRLLFVQTTGGGSTSGLFWLDPASPATVHAIPTTGLTMAEHPSAAP